MTGRVLLTGLLLATFACKKKRDPDAELRAELDQACLEAGSEGELVEARAWLQTTTASEDDKAEVRELADAAYAAGARKVSVERARHLDLLILVGLVIELPEENRAGVFAMYAAIGERYELGPERDVRQSCLLIPLDD